MSILKWWVSTLPGYLSFYALSATGDIQGRPADISTGMTRLCACVVRRPSRSTRRCGSTRAAVCWHGLGSGRISMLGQCMIAILAWRRSNAASAPVYIIRFDAWICNGSIVIHSSADCWSSAFVDRSRLVAEQEQIAQTAGHEPRIRCDFYTRGASRIFLVTSRIDAFVLIGSRASRPGVVGVSRCSWGLLGCCRRSCSPGWR
jgi:hypothetical protein